MFKQCTSTSKKWEWPGEEWLTSTTKWSTMIWINHYPYWATFRSCYTSKRKKKILHGGEDMTCHRNNLPFHPATLPLVISQFFYSPQVSEENTRNLKHTDGGKVHRTVRFSIFIVMFVYFTCEVEGEDWLCHLFLFCNLLNGPNCFLFSIGKKRHIELISVYLWGFCRVQTHDNAYE